MKYVILTFVVILIINECAMMPPMTVPQAESICRDKRLMDYGSCIRMAFDGKYPNWRADPEGDLVGLYIAWIEAAGTRVQKGEMTVEDGWLGVATLKERLMETVSQRRYQAYAARQAALSNMIAGLAVMNATNTLSGPAPIYVPPLINSTITCTRYPTNEFTGQTQITCR